LKLAEEDAITSVTSPGIIEETRDVLSRDRVPFADDQVDDFVEKVLSVSRLVAPETNLHVIEDDPDDDMIVECAVAADADYIISGDSHLLELEQYDGIPVISPADFLDHRNRDSD
jgi:putative PIN family toxin of toxin-antitoxin system